MKKRQKSTSAKKILSTLMALLMIASLCSGFAALAESGESSGLPGESLGTPGESGLNGESGISVDEQQTENASLPEDAPEALEGINADGSGDENPEADSDGSDEPMLMGMLRGSGSEGSGTPEISLIWDINASKFNYSGLRVNDAKTEIEVDLNNNNSQVATMQLRFSMNGAQTAAPGEIEIRVPMYIFMTREGLPTGTFKLNLQEGIEQGVTGFFYVKDNVSKELVIKNFADIAGGETFICQIDYEFTPGYVKSGFSNSDISATYRLREAQEVRSEALSITTNTSVAQLRTFSKDGKNVSKYESWQSGWGANPDPGSKDFIYLVWNVAMTTDNCSQPYEIVIEDIQSDGEIIGSNYNAGSFVGSSYTKINVTYLGVLSYNTYFLIKYQRAGLKDGSTLTNKVIASLYGVDNINRTQPDHTKEASGIFTYTELAFNYTGDLYKVTKSNSVSNYGVPAAIAQGSDDNEVSIKFTGGTTYPYSYNLKADVKGYALTLDGDPTNIANYGIKTYTTELTDDLLFLKDQRIYGEDYSITSVFLALDEFDYLSKEGNPYQETLSDNYSKYGAVELFYKTDSAGEWVPGGVIKRSSSGYTHTKDGVNANVSRTEQLKLPKGVSEIKFLHESNRYKVVLNAYITVELRSTEWVRELLSDQANHSLYNVCTLVVRDSKGAIQNPDPGGNGITGTPELKRQVMERDMNLHGIVLQHGTDFIGMLRYYSYTNINKYSGNFADNGSEQSLIYTIEMYEYGYYTPSVVSFSDYQKLGIVKEQTEGVFYDLLPLGTSASGISVKTYRNNKSCEFTSRIVANWQGSGRAMLIIKAKAPEGEPNYSDYSSSTGYNAAYSGFVLSYKLTNSYFNITDNGISARNLVAYRSSVGKLAQGNAASGIYAYFQKLESDERDDGNQDTVYTYNDFNFTKPTAVVYGVFKQVKAAGGLSYDSSATVFATGQYSYQLRYNSPTAGKSTNLVFFDVLENLGDWKGELVSVDFTQAAAKGIAPVVLYSVIEDIDLQGDKGHNDIDNAAIWTKVRPQESVKAIAVDLRHKSDGSSYEISPGEVVQCQVIMKAPADYKSIGDKLAINRVSYNVDYTLSGVTTKTNGLSKETKVSLTGADVGIEKSSNPASGTGPDHPAAIGRGEELVYTISISNNESVAIRGIEAEDMIPGAITVDVEGIKYFFGTDPSHAKAVAGADKVRLTVDGSLLSFEIDELGALSKVSFIVPATVNNDAEDGWIIANISNITKIGGNDYALESNSTWHEVAPALTLEASKVLSGRDLADDEFSFEVKDSAGVVIARGANKADGSIQFDPIIFKLPGEYDYLISEVEGNDGDISYDTNVIPVKVIVTREDGLLIARAEYPEGGTVFENEYVDPNAGQPGGGEDPDPPGGGGDGDEGGETPGGSGGNQDPVTDDEVSNNQTPPGNGGGNDGKTPHESDGKGNNPNINPGNPGTTPDLNPGPDADPGISTGSDPGTDHGDKPVTRDGHSLIEGDKPGEWIELDENGTPTGTWRFDADAGEWIFESFPSPKGNLPKTGDWGTMIGGKGALINVCFLVSAIVFLKARSRKAKAR